MNHLQIDSSEYAFALRHLRTISNSASFRRLSRPGSQADAEELINSIATLKTLVFSWQRSGYSQADYCFFSRLTLAAYFFYDAAKYETSRHENYKAARFWLRQAMERAQEFTAS